MPNIHTALPETQQSIFRPVVIAVVKQVQDITKMKDAIIYFPDDDKKVATSSGTIDSKDDRYVATTSKRMNEITVEEEIDREEISPTFFNGNEYTPILEDRLLGLILSPVYAKHNVTVTFNYSCPSQTEATRWLQEIRMNVARLRDINVHTVQYHYNLHKKFYDIIKQVYTLRETQAPYGQTFDQYIKTHTTPRLTVVGDIVGQDSVFAVAETQTEIYGIYEFEGLPTKPVKEKEGGMWSIGFTYRFNYDKPIGSHLRYPIMVHNQEMPLEFVSFTSDETRAIARSTVDSSRTQRALRIFRADTDMDRIKAEDGVIKIPIFDDFKPASYMRFTAGIIQALGQITETDQSSILSLQELGDVVLDDDVLQFLIESEYPYLNQPYKSIFHVDLYQNNIIQNYSHITVDSSLNISSTAMMTLRNQYHIRFSVVTDIDFITQDAIARLRKYPKVIYKVVKAINRAFRENPEMVKLNRTKPLTELEFNAIYRGLLGKEPGLKNSQVGWSIHGIFQRLGISQQLLHQITHESKGRLNTMIIGTLAYPKNKCDLGKEAQVGYLDIPLKSDVNY